LLVLAILGVIAAIVVPRLLGQQQEANKDTAKASIEGYEDALQFYAVNHNGNFPEGADSEGVATMLMSTTDEKGKTQQPLLDDLPRDPWDNLLNYDNETPQENGTPRIWSNGPNGENEDGSGDDINNWTTVEDEEV
jgi:general secretion pathway protein G